MCVPRLDCVGCFCAPSCHYTDDSLHAALQRGVAATRVQGDPSDLKREPCRVLERSIDLFVHAAYHLSLTDWFWSLAVAICPLFDTFWRFWATFLTALRALGDPLDLKTRKFLRRALEPTQH